MPEKTTVPFLEYFRRIRDYRLMGMILYPLDEVLFLVLCGCICGFDDIDETVMWGKANIKWLRKFLPYENNIPTAKTVRKIISHLEYNQFKWSFERWVANIAKALSGVIALDGKTTRGSKESKNGDGALHLVTAFSHKLGLILGQEKVAEKSNEITAIPELLKRLALDGTVVTIDAIGTQKEIAELIVDAKADYVLALKQNQKSLYEDVVVFMKEQSKEVLWSEFEETDAGHGRIEIRSMLCSSDIEWLKKRHRDWKDLKTIARIRSTRIDKKTHAETLEDRYYITSLASDAEHLLLCTRAHWSIENSLHWSLDVTFRDDNCRSRADHGAENMAIIRRAAFNILKKDRDEKLPLKRRRTKALLDPDYRAKVLLC